MALFRKRYHPPGTPPGTLLSGRDDGRPGVRITLIDYTADSLRVDDDADAGQCRAAINAETVTWVRVQGHPSAELMRELGETLDLHPLALEDVLNAGQRPKLEPYDRQLFLVTHLPLFENGEITIHQISLFLHEHYLVTFSPCEEETFDSILRRLEAPGTRLRRQGTDYLFYTLLDLIVDQGFPLLEELGTQIELLEETVVDAPDQSVLNRIHGIKRGMIFLRRSMWPQREMVSRLLRDNDEWITPYTRVYLRDCYDHSVQILDLVESYREMSASLLDIYMSSVSMRLNEVMRVLTVIATIFMPLTFITSIYGMNFVDNSNSPWAMPELHWYFGYPLVWLLIVAVVVVMLVWFRRKRWI